MHAYQSPLSEDTPDIPGTSDTLNTSNTSDRSHNIHITHAEPVCPFTPSGNVRRMATAAGLRKEDPAMHARPIRLGQEKSAYADARNAAHGIYIPPMWEYSDEPGDGEVLLGCCILLVISIVVSCALYYFLLHVQ